MNNKISSQRKVLYYMGIGLIAIGFILFMSSFFVQMDMSFSMETPSFFKRAVAGMICIIIGFVLAAIGRGGLAGSGIILDPEKAREDLKPFNSVKGGMINDVIENIDIVKNMNEQTNEKETKEVIKIKCRECGALNDEDAKFCKVCGKLI